MKYTVYYHRFVNNGDDTIRTVLEDIGSTTISNHIIKSKTIRECLLEKLKIRGWSSKVKLSSSSNITITSMYRRHALCLQTGNMGRFYADFLKLQYVFDKNIVDSSIYIVPRKELAVRIGSNIVNYERVVQELSLFESIITSPIAIIGVTIGE